MGTREREKERERESRGRGKNGERKTEREELGGSKRKKIKGPDITSSSKYNTSITSSLAKNTN